MNAFSKELAGMLCSDFQVDKVMADKIIPTIINITANRVEDEVKALCIANSALVTCALDMLADYSARDGFVTNVTEGDDVYKIWTIARYWVDAETAAGYMRARYLSRNMKNGKLDTLELEKYIYAIESIYREIRKQERDA